MGTVWVARHLHLDVDVAIKFLAPEYAASADIRARFEREAKASAQLRIPNVVQVYDYGVEDGVPYLAMELLEGEDLEALLARERRLSPDAMLGIALPVCKALARAHEVGLVHRDLKPGNIFLARQGGEEIVKLLDFGIAKDIGLGLSGAATRTGTLLGSPRYMSPEQVRRSKAIDHRSDLWSLGVVIFEGLTGQPPFQGEEVGELLVAICTANIPAASEVAPGLAPEVDRFLARALHREPELRFQSAQELAAAFTEAVRSGRAPAAIAPAAARTIPLPPLAAGTLAPSGNTLAAPPGRARRAGLVLSVLVGALALAGIVLALLLSVQAPDTASVDAPASASAPAPASAPTPAPAPASASASAPAPASASASAPASASASASASAPRSPPPPRAPIPQTPRRPAHDPLDKM